MNISGEDNFLLFLFFLSKESSKQLGKAEQKFIGP